jgi:hypothetical protein
MRDVDEVALDQLDPHWTPTSSENGSSRAPRDPPIALGRAPASPDSRAFGVSFRSNKLFDADTEAQAVADITHRVWK